MELVVIEKHAYLQLKLQIESLSAQIESVKKGKLVRLKWKSDWMPRRSVWFL